MEVASMARAYAFVRAFAPEGLPAGDDQLAIELGGEPVQVVAVGGDRRADDQGDDFIGV
jgi:hypothetical protein